MKIITINTCPGFDEWRQHARLCLQESIKPGQILWQSKDAQEQDLFAGPTSQAVRQTGVFSVSRDFLELARIAACHASADRFTLLYRVLWRLCHENKKLLHYKTDADILKLNTYVKAVRRDAYKIKAFLRFREVRIASDKYFIAWYEPEHYSLELSLPFFQTRFKNMAWSILTPYLAAYWDREILTLQANPDRSRIPQHDDIERYWLTYYAAIFNPARAKKAAMMNHMPKKYWKNMPETALIPDLLRQSESRARKMIEDSHF